MKVVKLCKKHGQLTEEQVYKEKNKAYTKGYYYRCKLCRMYKRAGKAYPCKVHGNLSLDEVNVDGRCKICARSKSKQYKKENREKYLQGKKEHYKNNYDYYKQQHKEKYRKEKEKYGALLSLKKVCEARGITIEDYHKMVEKQNNKCAICHQYETRKNGKGNGEVLRLSIDHCHKTNKVRGLLCHACNTAIGKFKDNTINLYRAIRYIKQGGMNGIRNATSSH